MGLPGDYKYSNVQLKEAVRQSKSYLETLRILGAHPENKYLKKRIREAKLDISHWEGVRTFYTEEKLKEVVPNCATYADVVRAFGAKPIGGNLTCAKKAIEKFNIDASHFTGRAHRKGKGRKRRKEPEEILILRDRNQVREKGHMLTRALLEIGHEYRCSICSINKWNSRPLTLRTDHINGKYWDCRKHNMRFICPNCDSQSETYCAKNRGK